MNSLTDFFNSPFYKYLLLSCLLGLSADSYACNVNGATVNITTLTGADIQTGTSVLGSASPGESTAPPLVIIANGCGEITMTVALEFDWDVGPSQAWIHGVSYSSSSGWFGAIGSSPGPEWAAVDNPNAGACSGNAYDQGFYYSGEDQSSVNPGTCDCDPLPAVYTEKDPDDPSDNWGTNDSSGEFGFTLEYCGDIGINAAESFTFQITDDGESGGWQQAAGCVFTLNYPVQILEPEITLDDVPEICPGECITLDSGVDCPDLNWSTGETGSTIEVCPLVTTEYMVMVDPNLCYAFEDNLTVTVAFCCEAEAGDLSANNIEFCPGDEYEFSVTDFNGDSEYTQQIFIADGDGTILQWAEGNETYYGTDLWCNDYVVGSFNFNTVFAGSILTIEDVGNYNEIPGNQGECWDMEIQEFYTIDDDPPVFDPVADVTVSCPADIPNDEELTYTDNCLSQDVVEGTDTGVIMGCDTSIIIRTWTITDNCQNTATATKTYTVIPPEMTPCDDGDPCTSNDMQRLDCQGNVCVPCQGEPGAANTVAVVVPPNLCVGGTAQLMVTGCTNTAMWYSDALLLNPIGTGANFNYNITQDTTSIWVSCMGGCSQVTEQVIVTAQAITPPSMASSLAILCDPTDVSTLSLSTSYTSYMWSDNSTGSTLSVSAGGTYSVTVTDATGCSGVASTEIMDETIIPFQIGGSAAYCSGSSTTLSGPMGVSSYSWMPGGQTTQTITVSQAGTYNLTVSNAAGCTATAQMVVTEEASLMVDLPEQASYCAGADLVLGANPGMSSYAWSTSESTPSITVSSPGDYTVTITDASGCEGVGTVTVSESASIVVDIDGDATFCAATGTTLTASLPGLSYMWSTGETTESITVAGTAVIGLTVTDANGCTGINSISITEEVIPAFTIDGATSICIGSSSDLAGPSGFASYAWNPGGETTPTITASAAGTYTLVVTNADGCTAESSVTVTEESSIMFDIQGNLSYCAGLSTELQGPTGYDYLWSNGEMTQNITVDIADTYSLIITDASGCSGEASVDVREGDDLSFTIGGASSFCIGSSSILSGPGGMASYVWSPGGETTETLEVMAPGTYRLLVTDSNGCTAEGSIDVTEENMILFGIMTEGYLCPGADTELEGPAGFDSYLWSPGGETDQSITVSSTGTFSLIISDANGCTGEATADVENGEVTPAALLDLTVDIVLDCNVTSATLGSLGAQPDITYEWFDENGDSIGDDSSINLSSAGTYTYVATNDLSGCAETQEVVVTQVGDIPLAEIVASPDNIIDCQVMFITLNATEEDDVDYSWQVGGQTIEGNTIDVDQAGDVTLIAVDTLTGCSSEDLISIEDLSNFPLIAFEQPQTLTCNNSAVDIMINDVNTSSGPTFTHQWYDPSGNPINGQGDVLSQVTEPGWYTYELIDAFTSCENIDSIFVDADFAEPDISVDNMATISCDETSTTLNLVTTASSSLSWTTSNGTITSGADSANPEVETEGWYFVTATADNGCTTTDSVLVEVDIAIQEVIIDSDMLCTTAEEATLMVVDVMGGTGPYTYELAGETNDSGEFSGLAAGDFALIVTDQNNCMWTDMISIELFDEIDFSVAQDEFQLVEPQPVPVTLMTNLTDYELSWSPVPSADCLDCLDPTINILTSEMYTVTIIDANGCSKEVTINIEVEEEFNPDKIFIPNVFTPDGDGFNDDFTIFHNEQVTLEKFVIYDRWGNQVFLNEEIEPGGRITWDGRHKGEKIVTGVYVYVLEYRGQSGETELRMGSLTMF